jgi:hypothetical protein
MVRMITKANTNIIGTENTRFGIILATMALFDEKHADCITSLLHPQ